MQVFRISEKSLSTFINRMVIVVFKYGNRHSSILQKDLSLPPNVGTASQRRKATRVLFLKGSSQEEKIIKVFEKHCHKGKQIKEKLKNIKLSKSSCSSDTSL